jgi:hypothetical protein
MFTKPRIATCAGALAGAVAVGLLANLPTVAARAESPPRPALELVATTGAVTVERQQGRPTVALDLGTFLVAGATPFEIRVARESYSDPLVARQVLRDGGRVRTKVLGPDLVRGFEGFRNFFRLTMHDAAGALVLDAGQNFCPNGDTVRLRPEGANTSPYPTSCPINPFALGSVWGIQAGWGTSTAAGRSPVNLGSLPDGVYIARISVTDPYREAFGIPSGAATVQVSLNTVPAQPAAEPHATAPAAAPPAGAPTARPGPRPDLVALPAFAIDLLGDNPRTPAVEPERLTFAATVWNTGPSPLVVEGFRRPDEAVMDAYQYFFDQRGQQVGYAPVGAMEWDPQESHRHWHFRDFAGYRLLDSEYREVMRSDKEAFCLANTDPIDLFVPKAVWQPENTDLHSSCGTADSPSIRQALATGHGDTYPNSAPGRALTVQGLPNGTYYIEVVANPEHHLHEARLDNNTTLRQVVLSGEPGDRTVQVPPFGLVDSENPAVVAAMVQ